MLVPRAAEIVREQRVNAEWAVQQVFHEFSAVFDEVADPYLRERKGDVLDLVGRLRMNLQPGRRHRTRAAARARRVVGSDRRRADAVDRRAGGLDEGPRLRDRRRAAAPITPRFWRARSRCRRSSACTTPAAGFRPGSWSSSTGPRTSSSSIRPTRSSRAPPITARIIGRRRPWMPNGDGRRRLRTASGFASTRTSSFPTISPPPATPAPKASGSTAPSSSSPAAPNDIGDEDRQYEIYRGMLEGMAPGPVTVRTFDVDEDQLGVTADAPAARWRMGAGGAAHQPPGAARAAPEPDASGALSRRSCARCCGPRRTASCASCFRSCRAWNRSARRGR